jgi:ribosomal protein S18 acetylase RimI-like enzyme
MSLLTFTIRALEEQNRVWVLDMVRGWGADFVVSRGRRVYAAQLPGFCAVRPDGEKVGLATYEIAGEECQLVTLHALRRYSGIGTDLLAAVRKVAAAAGCRRLWLVTTNDNLGALRFYQRRDFELVAVYRDLREVARLLKPSIPLVGDFGIPIRDEIELELRFDAS